MIHFLAAAVALSATYIAQPAAKIVAANPVAIGYGSTLSVTMTRTGGRVWVHVMSRGAAIPFSARWQKPPTRAEVRFTKTVTAKSGDQLCGDSVAESGEGYYRVWLYDATGRAPIGYACTVIPSP